MTGYEQASGTSPGKKLPQRDSKIELQPAARHLDNGLSIAFYRGETHRRIGVEISLSAVRHDDLERVFLRTVIQTDDPLRTDAGMPVAQRRTVLREHSEARRRSDIR